MDLDDSNRHTGAVPGVCGRSGICAGPCRPCGPVQGLLYRSAIGGGPQECRTIGSSDRAGAHCGATPVTAALCGAGAVVGSGDVAPRARACAAIDHPGRTDPGVDHRRHWLSQEGQPLGRRGAAVLRPVGQAGQLPSRGQSVGGDRSREFACCLPVVSTEGMGSPIWLAGRSPACRMTSVSRPSPR